MSLRFMSRKLLTLVVFLLLAGAAWAPSVAGMAGISGVVRDQSGAVAPGAGVVVSSEGQGVIRTLTPRLSGRGFFVPVASLLRSRPLQPSAIPLRYLTRLSEF